MAITLTPQQSYMFVIYVYSWRREFVGVQQRCPNIFGRGTICNLVNIDGTRACFVTRSSKIQCNWAVLVTNWAVLVTSWAVLVTNWAVLVTK
jgi:hypothetical protein